MGYSNQTRLGLYHAAARRGKGGVEQSVESVESETPDTKAVLFAL